MDAAPNTVRKIYLFLVRSARFIFLCSIDGEPCRDAGIWTDHDLLLLDLRSLTMKPSGIPNYTY